ncbi:Enolase-phosphatase E1 [Saitoella coloradoensis]
MPFKALLLDIEGTTTPISFVRDTLFPYSLSALPAILHAEWSSPSFHPYLSAFPASARESPETLVAYVTELTARAAKDPALKNLQGYIWSRGYLTGEILAPVYDDVPGVISTLAAERGVKTYIYSSGSIPAQKLLFGHSTQGDMTSQISGWFDLSSGLKVASESYAKIVAEIGVEAKEVLFLSDIVKELMAAEEAGVQVGLSVREGNEEVSEEDKKKYRVLENGFDPILKW